MNRAIFCRRYLEPRPPRRLGQGPHEPPSGSGAAASIAPRSGSMISSPWTPPGLPAPSPPSPPLFRGNRLHLNIHTAGSGSGKVTLLQSDGTPYPAFTASDCELSRPTRPTTKSAGRPARTSAPSPASRFGCSRKCAMPDSSRCSLGQRRNKHYKRPLVPNGVSLGNDHKNRTRLGLKRCHPCLYTRKDFGCLRGSYLTVACAEC